MRTRAACRLQQRAPSANESSDHEREHAGQRRVVARPVRAGALGRPEDAERRQHHADRELHRVLGHARERRAHEHADDATSTSAMPAPSAASGMLPCVLPKVRTMNATSRPSSSTPLNASVKPYQSRPARSSRAGGARLRELAREDRVLVVQRLEAARAQDRLAQPLQPEREQQAADDEAQHVDRDQRQRRAERGDDRRERDGRGAEPDERRAPAARDAGGEHDRERLDELDRAREERGGDEKAGGHA